MAWEGNNFGPYSTPLKIYHSFCSNMTCLCAVITTVGIYLPPLPFSPSFKHLWANFLAEKQKKWSLLIAVIPHSYIQLYNWQSTFAALSQLIIYIVGTNLTHRSVRISKIIEAKCLAQVHMACECCSQYCSLTLLILNAMLWQEIAELRADKSPFWDLNNTNNNHYRGTENVMGSALWWVYCREHLIFFLFFRRGVLFCLHCWWVNGSLEILSALIQDPLARKGPAGTWTWADLLVTSPYTHLLLSFFKTLYWTHWFSSHSLDRLG